MKVKLGDFISEHSERNKQNANIPVYSVTNSRGFVSEYFNKEVASKDKTTYKLVPRGYFAYNPSRINVGSVDFQRKEDCVIVSPLYVVFHVADELDKNYLLYYLKSQPTLCQIKHVATGSVRDNLKFSYLSDFSIELKPIEEQIKIAKTLQHLEAIIAGYKNQVAKLDELVKCRFVEMFGDMIYNPNKWEEKALQYVADIVSGITKGRKISDTKLIEVPYMSVCNVKDGYIDWTNLKTILATNKEIEQYRILANDVLMTEGGDPDKVGRGAIISSPPNNCIHQNHIFRVRLSEEVEAIYFEQYLQQPKARQYFYRSAKQTTGIASINMSQLKAMPVLLPPLALQEQFADFVRRIDKLRFFVWLV